ncbi:helix-turn-helix domain-containing protein [Roseococcus sp. SDR]|uniref:helix-turn-helix domain-containing protein n=1 Tax=Roseococcus sp. SDR TaxID=2835532 RepID=UPI001BCAF9AD|nr:helix-turn-helix domain-containing protein [Roseococcus sp. SDR]MBS7789722.1 helix-turn-helix domain-containing protein [Roseococcus sp. SDR]MBV1845036.1 helix-turn-helix domain-containing protein [Roseococcus sp. SDR]
MLHAVGEGTAVGFRRFAQPEDFAADLLGGQFEYLPIPGQPFSGTLRVVCLGDTVIQLAEDGAHIARAAFDPGIVGLVFPRRCDGVPPSLNGTMLKPTDVLLAPGGAEFLAYAPDPLEWGAIAFPAGYLEELAELAPMPGHVTGSVRLLALDPAAAAALAAAYAGAAALVDAPPDVLGRPDCARILALSMREMVASALTGDAVALTPGRATREALRVVRGAEEFLRAHLARPITRDELCEALAVSRRKLQDAFVAVLGLSPVAYLKMRRLVLARRALQEDEGAKRQVKSVALSHGFWHFGYFARDYRALFGETPSQTLARRHGPRAA